MYEFSYTMSFGLRMIIILYYENEKNISLIPILIYALISPVKIDYHIYSKFTEP